MSILESVIDTFRFKDTIIYKKNSDLQLKYDALCKLNKEYLNNEELLSELFIIKKGLDGENEIEYQLKKSNIGMYVLRDIKVKYGDLTAQIDYVIITPVFIYYVECKNLVGNITVNEKGDFIRELTINGKKIRKGMYSPLRQVMAQKEVIRKIWESKTPRLKKMFVAKNFDYYRRVLVVAANKDTIINTSRAPRDIKYKVLRADALVRQITYDLNHLDKDISFESRKSMEQIANIYLNINSKDKINYYDYYKEKYCLNDNELLKERLIEFRNIRSKDMNIPAYYVFTNDELERIIGIQPKTIEDLKKVLSDIKVKTHGKKIIELINKGEK